MGPNRGFYIRPCLTINYNNYCLLVNAKDFCLTVAAATFFGNGNNSSTIDLHCNNIRPGALLSSSLTAKRPNIEVFCPRFCP